MKWLVRLKIRRTIYLMLPSIWRIKANLFSYLWLKLLISKNLKKCQWADLNRRPRRYECRALTNWATLTWIISYYFIALLSNYLINFAWIKMYIFQLFFIHLWYFFKYTSLSFLILFAAFNLFRCFYSLSAAYPIAHIWHEFILTANEYRLRNLSVYLRFRSNLILNMYSIPFI